MSVSSPKSWATYWRDTLIDADLSAMEDRINEANILPQESIQSAVLPMEVVRKLFDEVQGNAAPAAGGGDAAGRARKQQPVAVFVAPFLFSPAHNHQYRRGAEYVIPVWVPAVLAPDGSLKAAPDRKPWVPRKYLEPTTNDFVLGAIEEVDKRLDTVRCPDLNGEDEGAAWGKWLEYAANLLPPDWHKTMEDAEYVCAGSFVTPSSDKGVAANLVTAPRHECRSFPLPRRPPSR